MGLLSKDRWGVGSLFVIGAFLGTGSLFLIRWAGTRGGFSLMMAVLLYGSAATVLAVKAAENIERIEFRGYDPVGKTGVVTSAMRGRETGSVRVDGLEWSATSEENLTIGEGVIVVRREGLRIFVKSSKEPRV
ncbi:MAG: hypothetical protein JRM80_00635 [Nitrososphaerota archaeon]|nr:hypothetical protein [Nitrososphaerota archaeon]